MLVGEQQQQMDGHEVRVELYQEKKPIKARRGFQWKNVRSTKVYVDGKLLDGRSASSYKAAFKYAQNELDPQSTKSTRPGSHPGAGGVAAGAAELVARFGKAQSSRTATQARKLKARREKRKAGPKARKRTRKDGSVEYTMVFRDANDRGRPGG